MRWSERPSRDRLAVLGAFVALLPAAPATGGEAPMARAWAYERATAVSAPLHGEALVAASRAACRPVVATVGAARAVGTAAALDPRRVPLRRTGPDVGATGHLAVSFARAPFGVAVTPDGRHLQRIAVAVEGLRRSARGTYVVWAATPSLDEVVRLGSLDGAGGTVVGDVVWNQFMVIVTREASADVERWQGPVLLTGFSPSSRMHTMRGHGIFEPHGAGC